MSAFELVSWVAEQCKRGMHSDKGTVPSFVFIDQDGDIATNYVVYLPSGPVEWSKKIVTGRKLSGAINIPI